jgi:hypothetical protein
MDYARRSMQRIGFLKIVLALASPSRAQPLEALTRAFFSAITKKIDIPADRREVFQQYVQELQLHRRYTKKLESAQLQDLYLCDPALPSHTGAITGDFAQAGYRHSVYVEIPTWAARLQLLRSNNYTLTDRGRILSLIGRTPLQQLATTNDKNPLCLSVPEKYVSLFFLIDADGDLLAAMYRRLLQTENFNRTDAGEVAREALEELRTRLRNASEGRALQTRLRLNRAIDAVRKQSSRGLGPRESIATPRIEPLVDCGLLQKLRTDGYDYRFTNWGRDFLQLLVSASSPGDFIENGLTRAMSLATGQVPHADPPSLGFLADVYGKLRSGLGYVSIRELVVMGIAQHLGAPAGQTFEIRTLEDMLKKAASAEGRQVRLALGRSGGLAQVRIDQRAFIHASGN